MAWAAVQSVAVEAATTLWAAAAALFWPALFFAGIALAVKGRRALAAAVRASGETRTNLALYFLDALLIAPPLAVLLVGMKRLLAGWEVVEPGLWAALPLPLTALVAVFAGDFIGYWRHRLEHTRWLWPSHAIHHSDTEMTWLALARFHPVNRLVTVSVDNAILLLLGLPPAALLINNLVRHYYGHFIHADLPWTFGPLGKVIVSPAMHRWHHARDPAAYGTNFATVFSLFDRLFGTYRVPGPCTAPLGIDAEISHGVAGQLAYPFRPQAYGLGSAANSAATASRRGRRGRGGFPRALS